MKGTLPKTLAKLTELERLELSFNELTGSLPSLAGLNSLQYLLLNNNNFSSVPADFFVGLTSLQQVYLDYNPFSAWSIPDDVQSAASLQVFSANSANIVGSIPDFFGTLPGLTTLHLSYNNLMGSLPLSFSGSSIQSLWLNGQTSDSKLNGSVSVIQNMTQLAHAWLQSNSFSGPLPDFSGLNELQNFSVRDNNIVGLVPQSLVKLKSLKILNITNNLLQGPTPKFDPSVSVDMISGTNSFCLPNPGEDCDPRVNTLLLIAQSVGYPTIFAENWKGNDPCGSWLGVSCNNGNITVLNFQKMGLKGTISPVFSSITSLERLILSNNNLTSVIPNELTTLPNLREIDVSNNQIYGKIPSFNSNVSIKVDGNPDVGKDNPPPGTSTPGSPKGDGRETSSSKGTTSAVVVVGSVIGSFCGAFFLGMGVFCVCRAKQKHSSKVQSPNDVEVCPQFSGSDQGTFKLNVPNSGFNSGSTSDIYSNSTNDVNLLETSSMSISIQVLKDVTNNFSEENILGRGGFGTVYKGKLHDGTKIAVKRMESGVVTEKGLDEFKSEITVLTRVRHKNLVALLGYCLDGNERLLVFEYMPQGTLSRFLFDWKNEELKPLDWSKRLIIVLDVARGVEYLHGLAHQSFIHRDLKPSNILLGDDLRAKVADFGLVRLAPDGKASIATKLAGTFGYLAPEYAVTGRVTTKIDVFSFGVILMELITGRRALDETHEEQSVHLVPWFRRMLISKDTFDKAIDPEIELTEDTRASISRVAELAGHCCAREPSQRPDMSHVVNVLSSLAEIWKPSENDDVDVYGIDFDMTLPQAMKKWRALDGESRASEANYSSSSYAGSGGNTQTSIPSVPMGLADSLAYVDGR